MNFTTILVSVLVMLFDFGIRSVQNLEKIDWSIHKPQICYGDENYTLPKLGTPIKVYLSINIIDLFDVSEDKMEFGLQTSIYDIWKDPIMKLDELVIDKPIDVPRSVAKCMWKPDLIFPNSKDSILFDVTVPNTVITVVEGGYFLRYSRYRLKISCQMHFQNYPMDSQRCKVFISTMYSKTDSAVLDWFGEPGTPDYVKNYKTWEVYKGAQPLQFAMGPPKVDKSQSHRPTGNTSQLSLRFKFARHLTASIINTYIPSSLVVCLSWVSFWIEPSAVPGRVTLGVTALLTLATEIVHARSLLPPVDYMTAMDVWLFGCLLMVFSSLIEFTLAYTLSRRQESMGTTGRVNPCSNAWDISPDSKAETIQSQPTSTPLQEPVLCNDCSTKSAQQGWTLLVVMNVNNKLIELPSGWKIQTAKPPTTPASPKTNIFDLASRVLFPLVLIVFGVVYWSYYATQITNLEDVEFKSR